MDEKIEEEKAVRMQCCFVGIGWVGGWVGGWDVPYLNHVVDGEDVAGARGVNEGAEERAVVRVVFEVDCFVWVGWVGGWVGDLPEHTAPHHR